MISDLWCRHPVALTSGSAQIHLTTTNTFRTKPPEKIEIPLDCSAFNLTRRCPSNYPTTFAENPDRPPPSTCPEYFRWIYEDLRPWARTGISRDMVERAKTTANFRPEINIKPWESLLKELREGNEKKKWMEREPYAYWKGNPAVAATRQDLMKCNVSEQQDWNARVYAQDWIKESQEGYKQSNLASQCMHRYKIYIEGSAWSVSEKYILACDSVTFLVRPHYYDFFTRSLKPIHHYWPIKEDDKCRSIKFAVDWGNTHKQKAQAIGKAASQFIQEELKMENVYDYMFHLLNEYAKLLTFKPVIPRKAVELCSESMVCQANGLEKEFMMESLVKGPSETSPCAMLPPYEPSSLHSIFRRKENTIKQVKLWENSYWSNQNKQP